MFRTANPMRIRITAHFIQALGLCLILGVASFAVQAQLPAPADSRKDAQRQRLAQLKSSALNLLRDKLASDLKQEYPENSRISVYLDVDAARFVLEKVDLFIDDRPAITRRYAARESGALLRNSAHRILRDNFASGSHRLRIEFSGRKRGAKPEDPELTGSLELDFESTGKAQAYVLPVAPKSLQPGFSFFGASRKKNWTWVDGQEDPRISLVRFLRDVGLEFASMRELLEISGAAANPAPEPGGYYTLLAHAYIDMGMRAQAVAAIQRVGSERGRGKASITPGQTLADAWLRLAALDYRRGDYARAMHTLENSGLAFNQSQRLLALDIKSRVLIAQQDYAKAASVLERANSILDKDDYLLYLPYLQRLYLRYNYALALIKGGQIAKGRTLLDRIGSITQPSPAERAVRDQANLALAYQLLHAGQGASAKPVFQRLPLTGSYTNNALLGLGWTELAPPGEALNKVSPGTFGSGWALGQFEQANLQTQDHEKYRRALVSWEELATRNPDDAAVQEALVVVPFALEKIERAEQAGAAYEKAISELAQSERKLREDIASLRQGRETRALLFQYAASGLPYTRWTDDVRTSNPIEEHLQNFNDVQRLQGALLESEDPGAKLVMNGLGYAAIEELRQAQRVIADALEVQLKRIEQYRTTAITGLTRHYDSGLYPEAREQASVSDDAQ